MQRSMKATNNKVLLTPSSTRIDRRLCAYRTQHPSSGLENVYREMWNRYEWVISHTRWRVTDLSQTHSVEYVPFFPPSVFVIHILFPVTHRYYGLKRPLAGASLESLKQILTKRGDTEFILKFNSQQQAQFHNFVLPNGIQMVSSCKPHNRQHRQRNSIKWTMQSAWVFPSVTPRIYEKSYSAQNVVS